MAAVVKIEEIHKIYDSGEIPVHAVRGVSIEIHRGEFVALMGASGSGKSTLMNLLGCSTVRRAAAICSTGSMFPSSTATSSPTSATRRSVSFSRASTCSPVPLLWKHGAAHDVRPAAPLGARHAPAGAPQPRDRRSFRPSRPFSEPAFRRPAAARRHRARAGQ